MGVLRESGHLSLDGSQSAYEQRNQNNRNDKKKGRRLKRTDKIPHFFKYNGCLI